jgi:hypothetical protein
MEIFAGRTIAEEATGSDMGWKTLYRHGDSNSRDEPAGHRPAGLYESDASCKMARRFGTGRPRVLSPPA